MNVVVSSGSKLAVVVMFS